MLSVVKMPKRDQIGVSRGLNLRDCFRFVTLQGIDMADQNGEGRKPVKGQGALSPEAEARLAAASAQREKRLAEALRENLKRRKAQGRGRAAASAETARD